MIALLYEDIPIKEKIQIRQLSELTAEMMDRQVFMLSHRRALARLKL